MRWCCISGFPTEREEQSVNPDVQNGGRVQAPTEFANEQSSVPPTVAVVRDQCMLAWWKQDYIVSAPSLVTLSWSQQESTQAITFSTLC